MSITIRIDLPVDTGEQHRKQCVGPQGDAPRSRRNTVVRVCPHGRLQAADRDMNQDPIWRDLHPIWDRRLHRRALDAVLTVIAQRTSR